MSRIKESPDTAEITMSTKTPPRRPQTTVEDEETDTGAFGADVDPNASVTGATGATGKDDRPDWQKNQTFKTMDDPSIEKPKEEEPVDESKLPASTQAELKAGREAMGKAATAGRDEAKAGQDMAAKHE